MPETFDFEIAPCNKHRLSWLKAHHNEKITEEEFVKAWLALREYSQATHKGSRNSPSRARHEYRNLVKKFGFFV